MRRGDDVKTCLLYAIAIAVLLPLVAWARYSFHLQIAKEAIKQVQQENQK